MFGKPSKEKQIKKLKFNLRDKIIQYNYLCDDYSCGANLAAHINPLIGSLALQINETLDKLALIDPATPKFRYPTGTQ